MTGDNQAVATPAADAGEALLARIMQRMNEAGGFPALDHSVALIIDAIDAGDEDTTPLVNAVLADVSLTQKVLRLANSAMYAPIGKSVATVSHAMMVLGFEAVGHLALGAKLIGSLGQMDSQSPSAAQELARSLLAGSVAGEVVAKLSVRNGEMGVVCTLLHRIGRLLTAFYLPEEWQCIRQEVAAGRGEAEAATAVLGMPLESLGILIARQWRLPVKIVQTMQNDEVQPPEGVEDWLLALTRYADQSAGIMSAGDGAEITAQSQESLAARFGPRLGLAQTELLGAVKAATDVATAQPLLARILVDQPSTTVKPAEPTTPLARLEEGLLDVHQAIDERGTSSEILNMVMEVIYRALDLSRVAILLLDSGQQVYRVRATLSAREPNHLTDLVIPVEFNADLVHVALAKKVDIYIDNPMDSKIASHMPAWVRAHALHPFFFLPLMSSAGKPLGLIFGQQQDNIKLSKAELAKLAALRGLLQTRLSGA